MSSRLRLSWDALVIGVAVVVVAIAWWGPRVTMNSGHYRYVLVYDVTQSMNVRDMAAGETKVSRLEAAKGASWTVVEQLECGAEVGIAIFTEHRSLLLFSPVEVCRHYEEIQAMITSVDWRMAWRARSEVAKGLDSAIRLNRALATPTRLVFFTDGHEAPPIHPDFPPRVASAPGEAVGVVVGVGGNRPMPIPKLDPEGHVRGFWSRDEVLQVDTYSLGRPGNLPGEGMVGVDTAGVEERIRSGTEHLSSLRQDYLRDLAQRLELDYLNLADGGDLGRVLRGRDYAFKRRSQIDVHRWFGLAGLALLTGLCLYPEWRSRRRGYGD